MLSSDGADGGAPSEMRGQSEAEPTANRSDRTPFWLFFLLGAVIVFGDIYLVLRGGGFDKGIYAPFRSEAELASFAPPLTGIDLKMKLGQTKYQTCAACHQPSGAGIPGQFPPLVGSEWVIGGGPNRLIRIVLHGLTGPIEVNGQQYNNAMAALGVLSDEDIAAILTYIRMNPKWGHESDEVTAEQVAEVRKATAGRTEPWTAEALLALPDTL